MIHKSFHSINSHTFTIRDHSILQWHSCHTAHGTHPPLLVTAAELFFTSLLREHSSS